MGINDGYSQMFCLKLKELRNLNSVKLALQSLLKGKKKKKSWSGGGDEKKRNKMLKGGFSCPLTILTSLGLVAGAV